MGFKATGLVYGIIESARLERPFKIIQSSLSVIAAASALKELHFQVSSTPASRRCFHVARDTSARSVGSNEEMAQYMDSSILTQSSDLLPGMGC